MLFSGLIGMGTKFAEVCLGLHYRRREPGGPMVGGPMMYITRGLGPRWRWMALAFSLFGATAALGIGNMVQANAVADGMHELLGVGHWLTGLVLVVAVGLVTVGGIQRIAHVAMVFVPFICGLYMLGALVVILVHLPQIPGVLLLMVERAFTPEAGIGGAAGISVRSAIRYGIARGVFSNEAGLGSAPIAHSTAMTDHPARQGLWGIFEVFVDTIVICAMTAFVILLTGARESGLSGAQLTMNAFGRFYGVQLGGGLVVFSMILTAYDTNLAWCFYGETCTAFLLGRGRVVRMAYRLLWLPFVILGAVWKNDFVWALADVLNGLMAIPNLIALLALGGVVVALSRGFLRGEPYQPPAD
jgi:AGCS family alanine or glycine:cation symporter